MNSFENKVVVVTGGTSGIGAATVKSFRDQEATVIFTGRNSVKWEKIASETGAIFKQVDAMDLAATKTCIDAIGTEYGHIDTLFLNAGSAKAVDILETTEEIFDFTYDLNVKSPVMTIQYALPYLRSGSNIALTASIAGHAWMRWFNIYGSTKAAVINIAKTYAGALAEKGIRINTVSPGPIDTDIFLAVGMPEEYVAGAKEQFWNMTPMKRMGTADEIAQTVLFLIFRWCKLYYGNRYHRGLRYDPRQTVIIYTTITHDLY